MINHQIVTFYHDLYDDDVVVSAIIYNIEGGVASTVSVFLKSVRGYANLCGSIMERGSAIFYI
jgi:hypothetical protein